MSEVYEHNPGDHEDPIAGPTWLVGFIGTILAIVIVLGVTALLKMTQRETFEDISINAPPQEITDLNAASAEHLNGDPRYQEYLDAEGTLKQRLIIPLDDAIDKVLEENQGR